MLKEFVLVTLLCTTMDKPCESYESEYMTSEDCAEASLNILHTAQILGIKETVLTYCTNIAYEE